MRLPLIICVVLHFLVPVVLTERYLFAEGKVWFKTKSRKSVKDVTYRNVAYIDQHLFPNVVNIRVWAKPMRLYEGAVRNLPKLEKVRLKECGIRRIPPGTFMNLPALRVVHMQDNDVTKIENGVFNYLPIEVLWLQRNAIEFIETEAFDNMPNLHTIKLNENQLMEWDNKWFSNTPQLTNLFFSRNQISELPARAFANIKTSHKINGTELVDTSIYLAMNEITEIHPEAFHGIDSLYRLRLRRNSITKIGRYLAHMTELHILNLDKNKLTEIDRRAFESMNTMSELNLARNRLLCLPYEIASVASKVNVTGNRNFKCDCLTNLRDKLHENRLDNEIIMEKRSCPSN